MTIKEELHRLVDDLDEQCTQEALEYLRWLAEPDEELAHVLEGETQIERGKFVKLDDLKRQLEPCTIPSGFRDKKDFLVPLNPTARQLGRLASR